MSGFAGRELRILFDDGGAGGLVALEGETGANFTITKDGIEVTDKNDGPFTRYIDDAVGVWRMEGTFEGIVKNLRLIDFVNDPDRFTANFQVMIASLGTYQGLFGISSFGQTGNEGAEAITYTGTIMSSGRPVFTPVP